VSPGFFAAFAAGDTDADALALALDDGVELSGAAALEPAPPDAEAAANTVGLAFVAAPQAALAHAVQIASRTVTPAGGRRVRRVVTQQP
jgi:hypothetical protein